MFKNIRAGSLSLLLMFIVSATSGLLPINTNTARAGEGDLEYWIDGSGAKKNKDELGDINWVNRLKFYSPTQIYDTATETLYEADPGEVFGAGSSPYIRKDGKPIYSPKNKKITASTPKDCYGVIVWNITNNGDYTYLDLIQPDISSGGSSCSVAGSIVTNELGKYPTNWLNIINDTDWDKYYGIADWLVAPFYWKTKDSIGIFDTTRSATKIEEGSLTYDNITTALKNSGIYSQITSGPRVSAVNYWKPGSCTEEVLITVFGGGLAPSYGYMVDLNIDPTSNIPNYVGYWDFWNGTNTGGENECMTGRKIDEKSYDWINYGSSPAAKANKVPISFANQVNDPDSNPVVDPPSGGTDSGDTGEKECVDNFNSFGVIVCWLLEGVNAILDQVESTITSLLEVDSDDFSASAGTGLYDAWSNVVRVSSGLLAIIGIVMVMGTALGGFRLFDAYTVKKVLPRIVIAAIGMWLSWALVTSYINAINIVGKGVGDLMWSPFAGDVAFKDYGLAEAFAGASNDTSSGTEAVAGLSIIGVAVAGGVALAGGAWALISALIPVVLFMLVGFIVLVLRQAIILFLLVTAPFAIVCWVLPNTKAVWDKWSKFLNQLLFMFPIFMGILAAGKIFSKVTGESNDSGFFSLFIPVIAYVTPFVLLPGIFKASGGALSKVTGAVSKAGGRAISGQQKKVQGYADAATARKKKEADQRLYSRAASGSGLANFQLRARAGQNVLGRSFSPSKSRREARNSQMDASRAIMQEAFEKQQLEEAETALRRGAIRDSAGNSFGYSDADSLLDLVKSSGSTGAQKRAALNRLTQLKATKQLDEASTHLTALGDEGKRVWGAHQDSNYSAMKEFAPQLVGAKFKDASAEAASKWTKDTWSTAAISDPGAASRLAYEVSTNDKLKSSIGYETMQEINRIAQNHTPNVGSPNPGGGTNMPLPPPPGPQNPGSGTSPGGTNMPLPPPPGPQNPGSGGLNIPPNSSTGGPSFS